jgi:hypothetical protein
MNFERVEKIAESMRANGLNPSQAAGLSLALEFAANHPEFATRFGEFLQVGLRKTLEDISANVPA